MRTFKIIFFTCLVLLTGILAPLSATAQTDDPKVYVLLIATTETPGIYIFDPVTSERLGSIPVLDIGFMGLKVNPSQTFAVVKSFDAKDMSTRFTGIQTVDLKAQKANPVIMKGKRIFEAEFNPLNESEVFVGFAESDFSNPQIGILNVTTGEIIRTMPMPGFPISFTFSSEKMYVVIDQRFDQGVDRLLQINLSSMSIVRTLDLPPSGEDSGTSDQSTITPDGKQIYIGRTNQVVVVNTDQFTFDSPIRFDDSPIRFNKEVASVAVAVTEKFRKLYVGEFRGSVVLVDLDTGAKTETIGNRVDFAISNNNKLVYTDVSGNSVEYNQFVGLEPRARPNGFVTGIAVGGDFNKGTPPRVKIVEPVNGQTLRKNSILKLKWNTSLGTRPLSLFLQHIIEISMDGGRTFRPACSNLFGGCKLNNQPNEIQEFDVEIPNENLQNVQIRVTSLDTLAGVGIDTVTFRTADEAGPPPDTIAPTVMFNQPMTGDSFMPGQSVTTSWVSRDNVAVTSQDLTLSIDGGQTFNTVIANGLGGNEQRFTLSVPNVEVADARLRLTVKDAAGNIGQAVSPGFRIQRAADSEAPRVVIAPLSNFAAGSAIMINWTTTDNREVQSQEIALSLDGGRSFSVISALPANSASFVLSNIAGLERATNQAMVRISALDSAGNRGQSIAGFNITPVINMASFTKPILTIMGSGFLANNGQATVRVLINGQAIDSSRVTVVDNNTLRLQGNRKKLGLNKANNTLQIVIDSLSSNVSSF
jgi:hypothetical protein